MSFSDKINKLFETLSCTNAEIARESGIDPSIVSRFRTGARQPRANSSQFYKLCKGIYDFAIRNEQWENLKSICNLTDLESSEKALGSYLITKDDIIKSQTPKTKMVSSSFNLFSEKLNAIMNMLDISNIRLARALNVDTSLISRFRNGLRTPAKNSLLMEHLCCYFYKTVKMNGYEKELSKLLGIEIAKVESGDQDFIYSFVNWFLNGNDMQNAVVIDSFLEKLDSLSFSNLTEMPTLDSIITSDILADNAVEYFGIDGIRRAAIRFLGAVAASSKPQTLKLYSDQNLTWLSSDAEFVQKWSILMCLVLKNKNQIKIIHSIDRNFSEMLIGIEKWLPLYMSGMIEGYYCKNASDSRFCHTLFLAPETAAINQGVW